MKTIKTNPQAKKRVLPFLILTFFTFQLVGQVAAQSDTKKETWLTAKKIAEKVWCIDDHGGDNMYLVEGKDSALLIDTGTGVADLASFVKTLTQLPVIVVNTHGHPDHSGGNFQYEKIYAQPSDFEQIDFFTNKQFFEEAIDNALEKYLT